MRADEEHGDVPGDQDTAAAKAQPASEANQALQVHEHCVYLVVFHYIVVGSFFNRLPSEFYFHCIDLFINL